MPQVPHQGAQLLGNHAQIPVRDIRLLVPAGLQFRAGGCDIPRMVISAMIVDVNNATQYIVPIDIVFAERLHKQLGELIADHNRTTLEK